MENWPNSGFHTFKRFRFYSIYRYYRQIHLHQWGSKSILQYFRPKWNSTDKKEKAQFEFLKLCAIRTRLIFKVVLNLPNRLIYTAKRQINHVTCAATSQEWRWRHRFFVLRAGAKDNWRWRARFRHLPQVQVLGVLKYAEYVRRLYKLYVHENIRKGDLAERASRQRVTCSHTSSSNRLVIRFKVPKNDFFFLDTTSFDCWTVGWYFCCCCCCW